MAGLKEKIKGERYARRLIFNENGETSKDHWDHSEPSKSTIHPEESYGWINGSISKNQT